MSAVTAVQDPLAALRSAPAAAADKSATDGQDRFLTLLVTQLKNQDPLNPLQNSELTSQLAQISTVQGIEKLNTTLASLAGNFGLSSSLQSAGLVGRQVLIAGQALQLGEGEAYGGFTLPQPADQVSVHVLDAAGIVVQRVELGAQPAGTNMFVWDGMTDAGVRVAQGTYTFSVNATAAGKPVDATTSAVAWVDGVVPGSDGTRVSLGRLGERALTDIQRIF